MSRFKALPWLVAAALLGALALPLFSYDVDPARESDWTRADGRLPLIKINRYAFPKSACAKYDCLAAKGGLGAWINVPVAGEPVAPVNMHLNWRRATHVANVRAHEAYQL